jgi:hypothetical protein
MNKILLTTLMAGMLSGTMLAGCVAYGPVPSAQITIGWHGDRYYDGHRYWERREWEAQHPERHDDPHPQW